MLKKPCSLSFVAAAAFVLSPSVVLAQPLQVNVLPPCDNGSCDEFVNSQRVNASALAEGKDATAINQIHQSSHQRQESNAQEDWGEPQTQISIQQVNANTAALGNNATAISNIRQSNHQNQWAIDSTPQSQISLQQVDGNTAAVGDWSTAVSNLEQSNGQIQVNF